MLWDKSKYLTSQEKESFTCRIRSCKYSVFCCILLVFFSLSSNRCLNSCTELLGSPIHLISFFSFEMIFIAYKTYKQSSHLLVILTNHQHIQCVINTPSYILRSMWFIAFFIDRLFILSLNFVSNIDFTHKTHFMTCCSITNSSATWKYYE